MTSGDDEASEPVSLSGLIDLSQRTDPALPRAVLLAEAYRAYRLQGFAHGDARRSSSR